VPRTGHCGDVWWERLADCLATKRSVSADFIQETIDPSGTLIRRNQGELLGTPSGLLRIRWQHPAGQALYVNKQGVQLVRPGGPARVHVSLAREPLAAAVLAILNFNAEALHAYFDVRVVPTTPDAADTSIAPEVSEMPNALTVVSLVPRMRAAGVSEILLLLEPSCPSLRRIVVLDYTGTAIRMTFTRMTFNVPTTARSFQAPQQPKGRIIRP